MSAVWWAHSEGIVGYLGRASRDGLEWRRHHRDCRPGLWAVSITGWTVHGHAAVMDDFGNLVEVKP